MTIWCAIMASYLVLTASKIDTAWTQVVLALVGVIGVYVGGETWVKKYLDPNSSTRGRKDE